MQEIPHEERGRQPHPTKLFEAPNGAGSPSHVVSASHSPHRHDNTRRDGSSSRATGRCSTRCVHALSFTARYQAWLAAGKTTTSPRPIGVTSFDCGRDTHYWAPPAQNRTGSFPAYGSHLGCLTAGLGLPYALRRR